jgi:LytS/YehU family sensor histidine kinase
VQANEFVQKLSSVYRYVLTHRDKETVLLQDELEFIKSYIFLNKIRFGENLNIHINLNEACLQLNIPTLSLQMLVENAIKHNIISVSKPLTVYINCDKEYIEVTNNLQAKLMTVVSSGIGLSNIVERYKYLTTKQVFINKTETNFSVKVPLV